MPAMAGQRVAAHQAGAGGEPLAQPHPVDEGKVDLTSSIRRHCWNEVHANRSDTAMGGFGLGHLPIQSLQLPSFTSINTGFLGWYRGIMQVLLTIFTVGIMPIPLIALAVWAHRHNGKKWRSKIDAELQEALHGLGVDDYTLIVDKLTAPSTDTTADVYRILHNSEGRYFLFIKIGSSPGVLRPLSKDRALLAAQLNE